MTRQESKLLEFLRDPGADYPDSIKLSIANKLNNILPNAIRSGLNMKGNTKIEAYLKLIQS